MYIPRHKVFISFHHGNKFLDPACGEYWKERFERLFHDQYECLISRSVQDGDIQNWISTDSIRQKIRDNFISEATVTIVLIGPETWKRKHVDWEISSSIRDTFYNSRCGLFGILLPTYPDYNPVYKTFNEHTIPPRLWNNVQCGYANIYLWNENPINIRTWIHEAFEKRNRIKPSNSYPMFKNNKPDFQRQWS